MVTLLGYDLFVTEKIVGAHKIYLNLILLGYDLFVTRNILCAPLCNFCSKACGHDILILQRCDVFQPSLFIRGN